MGSVTARPADEPVVREPLLGSVVELGGQYGVVWHVTRDTLRVMRIERGLTDVRLPMASEIALHLPFCLSGWGIACDRLIAWPRALCRVVGELDERCLLKVLDARRPMTRLPDAALADSMLSAARHRESRVSV